MTRRKTTMLLAAAAAVSFAAVGSVSAQQRGPRGGHGGNGPGLRGAAKFLELTEDQKTRLSEYQEQGRAERQRLHEATRAAHERLREALASESPDPATVGEAAIEGHRLREQQRAGREAFEDFFESLLTPEQLRKWEMMQAARAAGGGPGGRGPGGRRGRGPGRR